jgi:hypothetical protein
MEAVCLFEMLVPIYQTVRCHIPEERNLKYELATKMFPVN